MFSAFMDESFDERNSGFYAVCTVFGDGWRVLKGEVVWRQVLDKHNLRAFKASNLNNRPKIMKDFADALVESELMVFSVLSDQRSILQVLSSLQSHKLHRQYKESPYLLCYHCSFIDVAMQLAKRKAHHGVAFVCDQNDRYRESLRRSYPQLQSLSPKSRPYMGSLNFAQDQNCIPLQMADLVASLVRRESKALIARTQVLSPSLNAILDNRSCRVAYLDDDYLNALKTI